MLSSQKFLASIVSILMLICVKAQIQTQPETKAFVEGENYNYAQVLHYSILFYEAQRSGKLPESNRIPWRGDSNLNDGSNIGRDLTGGWFDAGDHVKFGLPMAWSTTVLAWGVLEYKDAYFQSGEYAHMLDCIKWPLEFFLKAHISDEEFVIQVGDGGADHSYWGPPEHMNMNRPVFISSPSNPGTEPVAEAAAAMAAGSLVFKGIDNDFSSRLLESAKKLYKLGNEHRAQFTASAPYYQSYNGYEDELGWAAAWLGLATGEDYYKQEAINQYKFSGSGGGFSWDGKEGGIMLLMYKLTGDERYKNDASNHLLYNWLNRQHTPRGLAYFSEWGSLRYAANSAFLALVAADYGIETQRFREWGLGQIHYMLGDCCGGLNPSSKLPYFSYVIGYGEDFPRAPHHRSSSCDGPGNCGCGNQPNKHILYGALVGGPDDNDGYYDTCQDYRMNEVATDYNAGFTSAVAALKAYSISQGHTNPSISTPAPTPTPPEIKPIAPIEDTEVEDNTVIQETPAPTPTPAPTTRARTPHPTSHPLLYEDGTIKKANRDSTNNSQRIQNERNNKRQDSVKQNNKGSILQNRLRTRKTNNDKHL